MPSRAEPVSLLRFLSARRGGEGAGGAGRGRGGDTKPGTDDSCRPAWAGQLAHSLHYLQEAAPRCGSEEGVGPPSQLSAAGNSLWGNLGRPSKAMEAIRALIDSYLMHTYYVLNLDRKRKCHRQELRMGDGPDGSVAGRRLRGPDVCFFKRSQKYKFLRKTCFKCLH